MTDSLRARADSLAEQLSELTKQEPSSFTTQTPPELLKPFIEAALLAVERETKQFYMDKLLTQEGLLKAQIDEVQRETIQQDRKWMRHTEDCDLVIWPKGLPVGGPPPYGDAMHYGYEPVSCSCGLADRLKEIEK